MRLSVGVAHHLGWAVVVTASEEHRVVDRRRIELIEAGFPAAPIHHEGGAHEMHRSGPVLDDDALAALLAEVRAAVSRAASAALDELVSALPGAARSISVRAWPDDFPTAITELRRPPYESRADSVMYCQVLATAASDRGWAVHRYDHRTVEADATRLLGERADAVLRGPREVVGPPWNSDHRTALAATIVAAGT